MDKQQQEKAVPGVGRHAINMGDCFLEIKTLGVDETLTRLNLLAERLREVNELIAELAQKRVELRFGPVATLDESQ